MVRWLEYRYQYRRSRSAVAKLVPLGRQHSCPCFHHHSKSELLELLYRELAYHTAAVPVLLPAAAQPCVPDILPLAYLEFAVPCRHCPKVVEASPGFDGELAVDSSRLDNQNTCHWPVKALAGSFESVSPVAGILKAEELFVVRRHWYRGFVGHEVSD